MDRRTTEHLTSDSLDNVSWIQKAALQLYRRNVPLLHMSFPVLVLQATNTGARRPGYEAISYLLHSFLVIDCRCYLASKLISSKVCCLATLIFK